MRYFKVKPSKEGLKVPFPLSKIFLKHEGQKVPKSSYWVRRLKQGDVVELKEEEEVKKVDKKDDVKEDIKEDKKEEVAKAPKAKAPSKSKSTKNGGE